MYQELEKLELLLNVIKDANRRLVILNQNIATAISIDSRKLEKKWRHDAMICTLAIWRLKERYNKQIKALTPFAIEQSLIYIVSKRFC
jgi:hypothetical protein